MSIPRNVVEPIDRRTEPACGDGPLAALKRFAATAPPQWERCELCGLALESVHPHLLDRSRRAAVCACRTCAILFADRQDAKFLRIPVDVRAVRDLSIDDMQWEELSIPISLAFFMRGTDGIMKAMYPSPAGPIESSLPLDPLPEFLAANAAVAKMTPEVEALLVSRVQGEEAALLVPIDECFRLTGLIRKKWRGLSGGTEVWIAIREFFTVLRKRAGLTTGFVGTSAVSGARRA